MKQSTSEAYAEIDTILNFMDYEYIKEIPEKLRNLFKDKKSNNYENSVKIFNRSEHRMRSNRVHKFL